MTDFFKPEDFKQAELDHRFGDDKWLYQMIANKAQAKIAPLVAELAQVKRALEMGYVVKDEEIAALKAKLEVAMEALLNIENDDGSIPNAIWKLRNDAISAMPNLGTHTARLVDIKEIEK